MLSFNEEETKTKKRFCFSCYYERESNPYAGVDGSSYFFDRGLSPNLSNIRSKLDKQDKSL